jgi:hypothetical protein
VFLAMNSRLGALTGGTQGTPPETITAAPAAPVDAGMLVDAAAPVDQAAPVDLTTSLDAVTPGDRAAAVDPAATDTQAASSDLHGSTPAREAAAATPDDGANAQSAAAPATAGSDQPAAPPGAQPPSDLSLIDTGTNTTRAPHGSRAGPRQSRRRSCCGGRRFAAGPFAAGRFAFPQRSIPFRQRNIVACPPRLLC